MSTPTTIGEARGYRYGQWGGDPKGQSYIEGDCIHEVFPNERGGIHHQCTRKTQKGSPYCHTHDPRRDAEKKAKRSEFARNDEALVARGEALLLRLGYSGYILMHARQFRHVEQVVIPFAEIERLLKELGR